MPPSQPEPQKAPEPAAVKPEAPDTSVALTAKEFVIRKAAPLPEVKGTSAYKPLEKQHRPVSR